MGPSQPFLINLNPPTPIKLHTPVDSEVSPNTLSHGVPSTPKLVITSEPVLDVPPSILSLLPSTSTPNPTITGEPTLERPPLELEPPFVTQLTSKLQVISKKLTTLPPKRCTLEFTTESGPAPSKKLYQPDQLLPPPQRILVPPTFPWELLLPSLPFLYPEINY